jgi:hypothetical protein
LVYRLDFYLKALFYVDRPEKIKNHSSGKNKEYNEAAMACARPHITPIRLAQIKQMVKKSRSDMVAVVRYSSSLAVVFRSVHILPD